MTIFTHFERQGRAHAVYAQFGKKIQALAWNPIWVAED